MNNWGSEKIDETETISASTWQQYFKTLLNKKIPEEHSKRNIKDILDISPWKHKSFNPMIDSRITIDEMKEALYKLKNNKSAGPDNILSEYLRIFGESFGNILLKLIRALFARHLYPPQWNTNYLRPIYKKGNVDDPDNYRGLAVGSSFAKLFSQIMLKRLTNYIEKYTLISPNQIGFMKDSRTSDHIFLLQTLIEKVVRKNKRKLFTAYIDFKKAYDTVDREMLFERLKQLEINGLFL